MPFYSKYRRPAMTFPVLPLTRLLQPELAQRAPEGKA
jgi:hypothetical protein